MPPPPPEDEVNKQGDHGDEQQETPLLHATTPAEETATPPPPPSAEAVARAAVVLQAAFNQEPPSKGKRKSREIINVPSKDPKCYECGKKFPSWKAVFGHLRIHGDRPFRGAFPPPVGADWTPSSSSSTTTRVMMSVPDKRRWRQEPRLGFGVDLNVPFMPMINDNDEVEVDMNDPKRLRIADLNRRANLEEAAAAAKRDEETKEEEEEKGEAEREDGKEETTKEVEENKE